MIEHFPKGVMLKISDVIILWYKWRNWKAEKKDKLLDKQIQFQIEIKNMCIGDKIIIKESRWNVALRKYKFSIDEKLPRTSLVNTLYRARPCKCVTSHEAPLTRARAMIERVLRVGKWCNLLTPTCLYISPELTAHLSFALNASLYPPIDMDLSRKVDREPISSWEEVALARVTTRATKVKDFRIRFFNIALTCHSK